MITQAKRPSKTERMETIMHRLARMGTSFIKFPESFQLPRLARCRTWCYELTGEERDLSTLQDPVFPIITCQVNLFASK